MVSSFTLISTKCLGGPGPDRNLNRALEHHLSGENCFFFLIPSYSHVKRPQGYILGLGQTLFHLPLGRSNTRTLPTIVVPEWV